MLTCPNFVGQKADCPIWYASPPPYDINQNSQETIWDTVCALVCASSSGSCDTLHRTVFDSWSFSSASASVSFSISSWKKTISPKQIYGNCFLGAHPLNISWKKWNLISTTVPGTDEWNQHAKCILLDVMYAPHKGILNWIKFERYMSFQTSKY